MPDNAAGANATVAPRPTRAFARHGVPPTLGQRLPPASHPAAPRAGTGRRAPREAGAVTARNGPAVGLSPGPF
jgi:hypothetical protein